MSALSLLRLIPNPPGRIVGGEVIFEGQDLMKLTERQMRSIRGNKIAMIFQEPMTSLNPVLTIGRQLTETVELHMGYSPEAAVRRSVELLEMVGIPDARSRLSNYPHQFSGGMRQRVMIAIALSCTPRLLLADEATTALDVTIQAQILELIKNLSTELGTAVIIITHNLGVVARYADRVNVMYAGKIIERGTADEIYEDAEAPVHARVAGLRAPVGCRPRGQAGVYRRDASGPGPASSRLLLRPPVVPMQTTTAAPRCLRFRRRTAPNTCTRVGKDTSSAPLELVQTRA